MLKIKKFLLQDWKSELHFLLDLLKNENDQQDMAAKEDDMAQIAREKITAIYGKQGLNKDYHELVGAREFPEIPSTGTKTLNFESVSSTIILLKRTSLRRFSVNFGFS